MLDETEYAKALELYSKTFRDEKLEHKNLSLKQRFIPLLNFYNELTGWNETVPNAIMHHRISQYGPSCEKCSKPYRTPQATFCAACGNRRTTV